jgi:hypothetical protein
VKRGTFMVLKSKINNIIIPITHIYCLAEGLWRMFGRSGGIEHGILGAPN